MLTAVLRRPKQPLMLRVSLALQQVHKHPPPQLSSPLPRGSPDRLLVITGPPPGVISPGPGMLSVRNNVGWSLEPQPVEYAVSFM